MVSSILASSKTYTVRTGPNISLVNSLLCGSVVKIIVGSTKNPFSKLALPPAKIVCVLSDLTKSSNNFMRLNDAPSITAERKVSNSNGEPNFNLLVISNKPCSTSGHIELGT